MCWPSFSIFFAEHWEFWLYYCRCAVKLENLLILIFSNSLFLFILFPIFWIYSSYSHVPKLHHLRVSCSISTAYFYFLGEIHQAMDEVSLCNNNYEDHFAGTRIRSTFDFGHVTLDMTGLRESDCGIYTCRAINRVGEAVSTCNLKVYGKSSTTSEKQCQGLS